MIDYIDHLVTAKSERDEIARGKFSGRVHFTKFGHNTTCGTGYETVWHGSSLYTYLTGAEQLKISSVGASADDDTAASGIGARTLHIHGLNSSYNTATETIDLNGSVVVTTVASYIRVCCAEVTSAGSTGYNLGAIHVRNNADDTDLAICIIQEAASHACIYTIPSGKTGYITSWRISESSNKGADISVWIRNYNEQVWRYKKGIYTLDNIFETNYSIPIAISEKSDIEVRSKAIQDGARISSTIEGWYE